MTEEETCNIDKYPHIVKLNSVTKKVAQKYFIKSTKLEKAITLGIKRIMEAETLVIIANGINKAEIVKKAIEDEVSASVPASILKVHKNSYIFLDKETALMLEIYKNNSFLKH